eukprot:5619911-Amphidinium_carterae.1
MDLSHKARTVIVKDMAGRIHKEAPMLEADTIESCLQDTLTALFLAREAINDLWRDMLGSLTRRQRRPTWD